MTYFGKGSGISPGLFSSWYHCQMSAYFFIGSIPIEGKLVLAPMDGITSHPFRLISRNLGSAFSVSEFLLPTDILMGHPHLEERFFFTHAERPFGYQLLDNNPEAMLQAAQKLMSREPDFLDINLGCPARSVCNRGAGAALLKQPAKVGQIISYLARNLNLPITAKIRLGWDDQSRNYREIARILEDSGVAAITVHARTRKQSHSGMTDLDAIGEIKQMVSVPVIANGSIHTIADVDRVFSYTQCDAVMIGRGAVRNPWIFAGMDRADVPPEVVLNGIIQHLNAMITFFGERRGILLFRKHLIKYLEPYHLPRAQMLAMITCEDHQQLIALLNECIPALYPLRN